MSKAKEDTCPSICDDSLAAVIREANDTLDAEIFGALSSDMSDHAQISFALEKDAGREHEGGPMVCTNGKPLPAFDPRFNNDDEEHIPLSIQPGGKPFQRNKNAENANVIDYVDHVADNGHIDLANVSQVAFDDNPGNRTPVILLTNIPHVADRIEVFWPRDNRYYAGIFGHSYASRYSWCVKQRR